MLKYIKCFLLSVFLTALFSYGVACVVLNNIYWFIDSENWGLVLNKDMISAILSFVVIIFIVLLFTRNIIKLVNTEE